MFAITLVKWLIVLFPELRELGYVDCLGLGLGWGVKRLALKVEVGSAVQVAVDLLSHGLVR